MQARAEKRRIGADPPAHHHGSEPRRRNQHDSEQNRNDPAERHPPAAMVFFEIIGGAELQRPRDKGPSREKTDKDQNGKTRQGQGDNPRQNADNALEGQKSPVLLMSVSY